LTGFVVDFNHAQSHVPHLVEELGIGESIRWMFEEVA
jgi:hypothetical protein